MPQHTTDSIAMFTTFFSSQEIEKAARLTGFVKRASKITGKIFLTLVTFAIWQAVKTSFSQLAAKVTDVVQQVEVSPEAICQRMHPQAVAFLKELIRTAVAKIKALEPKGDDGLFEPFAQVFLADSTGFGLPDTLRESFPGAGGSGSKAGAKIELIWNYKTSTFHHFEILPGTIPDNTYIDTVVQLAHPTTLFLFDLGFFKVAALATLHRAKAYFLSRFQHQTKLFDAGISGAPPLDLVRILKTVSGNTVESTVLIGEKDRVPSRLLAYRLPQEVVSERRRRAKQKAKERGYTPSQAPLALLAWNLFITNVPTTIWATETVAKVYRLRWQIELIFKSWKSYHHVAAIRSKKADTALCYLYGRFLLMLLTSVFYPPLRAHVWGEYARELSLLKLVRHFQTLAESWMKAIFQSEIELHLFLKRSCKTATRLAVKASRKRQTTAQLIRDSLRKQTELANQHDQSNVLLNSSAVNA